MLSKSQKWVSASIGALFLGNMKGCFFLRAFLFRGIFMRFSRDMQNALQIGISLHRGPVGEPGGVHLPGFFRKKKSISGFLSWTQRTLRFCLGAIGTLIQEQDSPELILNYGAQRACL